MATPTQTPERPAPAATRPVRASAAPASGLPARAARRLQAPSWRDVRLVVGVALVVLATVLGSLVVAKARETTSVLTVARAIPAGQPITPADLSVSEVRLGTVARHYLAADRRPAAGAVAARDLRPGDLLPADAVAAGTQVTRRRVVLPVRQAVAAALVRGSTVEVWVSDRSVAAGAETFAAPRQVLAGAVVADPAVGRESVGGADTAAVALWVPKDAVPGLLAAVDRRSTVALVPQPGSPVQEGA